MVATTEGKGIQPIQKVIHQEITEILPKAGKLKCPKCNAAFEVSERSGFETPTCNCYSQSFDVIANFQQSEKDIVKLMINTRIEQAHIPHRMIDFTFENFPGSNNHKEQVQTYAKRSNPGMLVMVGNVGTGKTSLAISALKNLARLGTIKYFYAYDLLLERLMQKEPINYIRELVGYNSIVIEEVGLQLKTEAALEFMERLLIGRYDECKNTILISNMEKKEFENLSGVRILDRINQKDVVIFDTASLRRG